MLPTIPSRSPILALIKRMLECLRNLRQKPGGLRLLSVLSKMLWTVGTNGSVCIVEPDAMPPFALYTPIKCSQSQQLTHAPLQGLKPQAPTSPVLAIHFHVVGALRHLGRLCGILSTNTKCFRVPRRRGRAQKKLDAVTLGT